jgi:catechol 2,3-dioxygenase
VKLPPDVRLGAVHLTIADLDRAVGWYERVLGLHVHHVGGDEAELGDGVETVVVLHEDTHARPAGRHAGLYHYALLYPTRSALARAALRLVETRTPVQGASDHRTHEAIYLPDADGIGIELAADRPREQWPPGLGYGLPLQPLDVDDLLATLDEARLPVRVDVGLRIGHVHLHVGDVDEAVAFYCETLGFELQAHRGSAAFVSAGGYHHHVGLNVWQGRGVGPAPPHTVGLRHWTLHVPRRAGLVADLVCDPWDIAVAVAPPSAPAQPARRSAGERANVALVDNIFDNHGSGL